MAHVGQRASQLGGVWRWGLGWGLLGLGLLVPAVGRAGEESSSDELRGLQRAALRYASLDDPSRRSLEARLRLSAFLPHLRMSVGRGLQWSYPSQSDVTTPLMLDGDKVSYSVAAEWDLSRLIFAREDLTLYRDARRTAGWRSQLLLRVARLYALRCQLEQEPASAEGEVSRPSGRALAVEQALIAVTGDEHAGRKHQHCPQLGRGSLAGELEALTPALTPPPLSLAGDGESAEP